MKRYVLVGVIFLSGLVLLSDASFAQKKKADAIPAGVQAPMFEVDPFWPKPLPNHWILGAVIGVSVDKDDNIWILHRPNTPEPMETYAANMPPGSQCCIPAPPVLEFNQAGDLIGHWGGPGEGYNWANNNHGIFVDYKGFVWVGGNGHTTDPKIYPGAPNSIPEGTFKGAMADDSVLKFTKNGKFVMQIGHPFRSKGDNDTENLNGPAGISVDPKTDELYIADGYGNNRVIVFDANTGKFKRQWGAYGNKPVDDTAGPYDPDAPVDQQFRSPLHCARLADDGLVYVCDRRNDRLQVFHTDGTFVKEMFINKRTLGDGSVSDIAFSRDPEQKYIYVADLSNDQVHILLRDTLEILTSFGDGGRQPGQFYADHSIAADLEGNIYTTETFRGQRVQKFIYKGIGPVTKENQGVLWPKSALTK
jgi:DNA-binding beta-propeller fold protein YncE